MFHYNDSTVYDGRSIWLKTRGLIQVLSYDSPSLLRLMVWDFSTFYSRPVLPLVVRLNLCFSPRPVLLRTRTAQSISRYTSYRVVLQIRPSCSVWLCRSVHPLLTRLFPLEMGWTPADGTQFDVSKYPRHAVIFFATLLQPKR